ncbi:hypothetical protein AG1IA_05578 [Rhizoctonia solani AG-1 IA]|uniref:Uncharacterized protein n=1 Tax=Thanatephorus cucumeris (strain AG1-IA) TaxID=983506 RepID=L8WUG2_THACA|nr:hypothetical protein AG1IA_05578 [Rhizoctonia solani AG-1 IA]
MQLRYTQSPLTKPPNIAKYTRAAVRPDYFVRFNEDQLDDAARPHTGIPNLPASEGNILDDYSFSMNHHCPWSSRRLGPMVVRAYGLIS